MTWRLDGPQGNEAAKIRWEIVPYTRGAVVDLGCGSRKAFPHFLGIDSGKDTKLFGTEMQPDVVVEDCSDLLGTVLTESCDAVFSSHLLEHIEDYAAALKDWWRCIKVGGHLVLYLPHKDYYPNIGQPGGNPDHKHDFRPADIISVMRGVADEGGPGWDLVELQNRNDEQEYSFLLVFRKLDKRECVFSHLKPRPAKTVCVVRYGGFGDMLQASNVLPALKRQGYHVTVMTTPNGQNVLAHDPHVDAWFIQDTDQVPNAMLSEFWAHQAKRFTKFVNLSESVEGTLLAMPGRTNNLWPDKVRRAMLGINYGEFTAALAEVPYVSEGRFYPTSQERTGAKMRQLEGSLSVLWTLSGSSCHKFYPGQDIVMARLLSEFPHIRIFTVGDEACKILEQGWENEPRVVRLSGELGIRDTLALAQVCDVVIGCETGVLSAVAFEPNRKVVLLSHSSAENLTKHWRNTLALTPPNVSCYPCHRLHYTWDHCHQDEESGAAVCQRSIHPDAVYAAALAADSGFERREMVAA